MEKNLSIAIFGFDVNDEEEYTKNMTAMLGGPIFSPANRASTPPANSSIGINVNPSGLFTESEPTENAVDKSVVVRGQNIGDVKRVVMSPNGDIKIYHGGI